MNTSKAIRNYGKAVDALEPMLSEEFKDLHGDINEDTVDGFFRVLGNYMKLAFKRGMNGDSAPQAIAKLRGMNEAFLAAVATAIECAYDNGRSAAQDANISPSR